LGSHHINPGDWVTTSRQYAIDHGESALGGKFAIAAANKPAKELFTAGDSFHEWGWHPSNQTQNDLLTLYRGESVHNRGGNFYSPDAEWARQFTQSGQSKEILQRQVPSNAVYEPPKSVYAGDPDAVDAAIAEARAAGKGAVRLSEGHGEPPSIFVFNKRLLTRGPESGATFGANAADKRTGAAIEGANQFGSFAPQEAKAVTPRREEFQAFIAENGRRARDFHQELERTFADKGRYAVDTDYGRKLVLTKNTYPGGAPYRITTFDGKIPAGHFEVSDLKEAANELRAHTQFRGPTSKEFAANYKPAPASEPFGSMSPLALNDAGRVQMGAVTRDVAQFPSDTANNRLRSQMTRDGQFTEADIPIRSLYSTQKEANPDFAQAAGRRAGEGGEHELPAVYRVDGKNYLADGHHRVADAATKGSTARVRFYDMDKARSGEVPDPRQMTLLANAGGKPAAAVAAFGDLAPETGIRAYHGSPHDFDRFDISKIGSGEGAQAYGSGLYFAENENTARSYRDALAPARGIEDLPQFTKGGQPWFPETPNMWMNIRDRLQKVIPQGGEATKQQIAKAISDEREFLGGIKGQMKPLLLGQLDNFEKEFLTANAGFSVPKSPGRMYEVNIGAKPESFLDWDRPMIFHSQPPAAEKFAEEIGYQLGKHPTSVYPHEAIPALGNRRAQTWSPEERAKGAALASQEMRDVGIPGIRYHDSGSRGFVDADVARQKLHETQAKLNEWIDREATAKTAEDRTVAEAQVKMLSREAKQHSLNLSHAMTHKPTHNYVVFDDKLVKILRKYALPGAVGAGGFGSLAPQDEQ
jgi:hypothetical protein